MMENTSASLTVIQRLAVRGHFQGFANRELTEAIDLQCGTRGGV
jgi:hypothetical protein